MALSRTPHTPAASAVSGSSFTSGLFTFPDGHLVVVIGEFMNDSGSEAPANLFTLTDTGASLTWNKRVIAGNGETDFAVAVNVWTAIGNGTPCVLNATKSGNAVAYWFLQPYTYTGFDAGSPVGGTVGDQLSASDGTVTQTLSAPPASASDVLAATSGSSNGGSITVTHGTGWTELYDTPVADQVARQIQVRTGSTSDTVTWDDISVGGSGYYHAPVGAAIEIKASTETSVTRTPVVGVLAMAGLAAVVAASGSGAITTQAGALTLTGQQPVQDLTVAAPVTGSMTMSGNAPTVLRSSIRQPVVGALTLSGGVPAVFTPRTITASLGSLTLTGLAPTITVGVNNTHLIPTVGSVTINGNPVIVTRSSPVIQPSTGVLTLQGNSPSAGSTGMGYLTRPFSFNWWYNS